MTTLTNGNRIAKIKDQGSSFYTFLIVNKDQVVGGKAHGTFNGAKRYAEKHINS